MPLNRVNSVAQRSYSWANYRARVMYSTWHLPMVVYLKFSCACYRRVHSERRGSRVSVSSGTARVQSSSRLHLQLDRSGTRDYRLHTMELQRARVSQSALMLTSAHVASIRRLRVY